MSADTSTSPTLRPPTGDDLPAILEVYRACEDFLALGPQATASEAMVLHDMELSAATGGLFRGIWLHAALIGVVDHEARGHEGCPGLAYVALLMVARRWRGRGVGATVVRQVEAEVARQGATTIGCSVQVNNPGSLRFWQRLGYVVVTEPRLQADGTTSVELRKPLPT